jgi:nitroimidazol reductase NimA-like FMN-containing flavoprotein (pyridoxamine 5'-phosphate oxidase superfamily)
MDKYVKKAREIIENNIYCTISTASLEGEPWISPVFFAFDEKYNIYWVSNKDSLHSTYIRSNPRVAVVIFNSQAPEGEGDGVYFKAKAEELSNPEDINKAMILLNKRVTQNEFRVKKIGEVINEGVWRIYKATPAEISKLTEGEFINGQYVDKRIVINLFE